MEALLPLLLKLQDPAVLVPVVGCIGLGWLHVIWRREEREDRKTMLSTFTEVTKALNGVQVAMAQLLGKLT
jgi:hypothetical protein